MSHKFASFDWVNTQRKGETIQCDTVKESASAYHLIDEVHGNVVVIPFAFITGGEIAES